ncbi:hypothetical protein BV25DRAFT_1899739 [Artomyces pyxidatus]|uniref:Uncharacterized protein n=1 Tax=Artomyces pyxidatus TaxID=48021 RepID=A0ACB8T393_9AGAM|nr:hypothetical protein BV25DRAFT_1899739 [Artomyces pyxidatus]
MVSFPHVLLCAHFCSSMVNWNDPIIVARDYDSLVKLIHTFGGIYIWEFCTNIAFDWSIVSGKRPYRWTFWLYLGCRLSGLLALTIFAGFDASSKINCQVRHPFPLPAVSDNSRSLQAWVVFAFSLAYLAFSCASALVVLRITAIWERKCSVVALAVAVWLTNAGFIIRSVVVLRGTWNEEGRFCEVLHTSRSKDNILVTAATDIVLLVLMLFGLLRWRKASNGLVGGIWRLLYTQGIWWIAVVAIAEIPPSVFILLNLNDPFNLMFQVPGLIIMAIGAARIYRRLADYSSIDDLQISSIVNHTVTPGEKTETQNDFRPNDTIIYVIEPTALDVSADQSPTTTTTV